MNRAGGFLYISIEGPLFDIQQASQRPDSTRFCVDTHASRVYSLYLTGLKEGLGGGCCYVACAF